MWSTTAKANTPIVSVHVNEVLYRSQIFIEKSKTLNYFFNIYDTLVYCDLAALIHMSALVLVSFPAYYDTWSPFIVCGRIILPCRRRSNWSNAACPQRNCLPCTLVNFRARPGKDSTSSLNLEFSGFVGIPKPMIIFTFSFSYEFSFFSFLVIVFKNRDQNCTIGLPSKCETV